MGNPAVWSAARSRRTVRVVTFRSSASFGMVFVRTAASCRSSVHCRISSLLRPICHLSLFRVPDACNACRRLVLLLGFRFFFAFRGVTSPVIANDYSGLGAMNARERSMTAQAAAQAVVDAVGQITFGSESTFENLSVVPLLRSPERDADYVTLDEALARGWARITEVNDAGQVSALKIVVSGAVPVLLLDGEELIGAKQNRVINLTIMAPPQRETVIPVSCVESGRWRHVSRGFASAPRAQFAEGRAAKMRHITASLARSGSRASDQSEVWNLIGEKAARLSAASDTSAMSAMFEKLETPIAEFVAAFMPVDNQVGAVFFINGAQAGLELFDAASTWRKLAPKLVRSYAVDAIDRRGSPSRKQSTARAHGVRDGCRSHPCVGVPGHRRRQRRAPHRDRRRGCGARGRWSPHPPECVSRRRPSRVASCWFSCERPRSGSSGSPPGRLGPCLRELGRRNPGEGFLGAHQRSADAYSATASTCLALEAAT